MNGNLNFDLKESFKRRKKLEERKYPKKDWPVGYEPTEQEMKEWFEEGTGIPVSFEWKDIGGGKKRGVFTPIKKTINDLEKSLGNGQPVNFKIENQDGKEVEVSKEGFTNWIENGKNVKTPPKESLVYGVKGNIDGLTYYMERKGKNEFIKESYYEPRSEEDKNRILEQGRKRQEQEKSQTETSPNSDKKEQKSEKETNQEGFSQRSDDKESAEKKDKFTANQQSSLQDKDNKYQNIYYGVGVISLVLLVMSVIVVWMKKKR